jgi:DNA repair protein RecO (recombination protein O)
LLQPFRPLLIALGGRGEVKTLTRVEPASPAHALGGRGLYCGFYLNELLLRLLGRADPHEHLFDHYAVALAGLAQAPDPAPTLRRFELRLLEELGYALVLDRDAERQRPLRPQARYRYDPDRGPVESPADAPGFSVAGRTLLALAGGEALDATQAREAKELMRRVLDRHLGGRPLKSRELFRTTRAKEG